MSRGRKRKVDAYVYVIRDGVTVLYVGKGTGRRFKLSAAKHGGEAEIVKRFDNEDDAFAYERELIAELMPQNNICHGGNGGRVAPKVLPAWQRAEANRIAKEQKEIKAVGSRRYCARWFLQRLNAANCDKFGVSKVDLSRLKEVANGPRC